MAEERQASLSWRKVLSGRGSAGESEGVSWRVPGGQLASPRGSAGESEGVSWRVRGGQLASPWGSAGESWGSAGELTLYNIRMHALEEISHRLSHAPLWLMQYAYFTITC
jgi:hypothetical protein